MPRARSCGGMQRDGAKAVARSEKFPENFWRSWPGLSRRWRRRWLTAAAVRLALFSVTNLPGFMDLLAGEADVGDGGLIILVWNNLWFPDFFYFATFLRRLVFIRQPTLGRGPPFPTKVEVRGFINSPDKSRAREDASAGQAVET